MRAAMLLLALSACAAPPRDLSPHETVVAYYRSVLADSNPISPRELQRQLPATAIVEPIGWTASDAPFANVVSGTLRHDSRTVDVPRSWRKPRARSGRLKIEIIHIDRTDLPEYFEFIDEPRVGFASIERDRIFLDHRRNPDSALLDETFEHELQHLLDRPLYRTLSPADLETRGMIRGLSRGRIPRINLDRLYFALENADSVYSEAAFRILDALRIIVGEEPRDADDSEITNASESLARLLGL